MFHLRAQPSFSLQSLPEFLQAQTKYGKSKHTHIFKMERNGIEYSHSAFSKELRINVIWRFL